MIYNNNNSIEMCKRDGSLLLASTPIKCIYDVPTFGVLLYNVHCTLYNVHP